MIGCSAAAIPVPIGTPDVVARPLFEPAVSLRKHAPAVTA